MSEALQQEIRHLRTLEGSARDPRDRVFIPLADAHLRLGDLGRARELLEDGLTRHPDFVSGHVLMARLLQAEGDSLKAEERWATARRLDPQNAEALLALGRILVERGESLGGQLVLQARAMDPTAGGQEPDADLVTISDLAPDLAPDSAFDPDADTDVVSIADLAPDTEVDVVSIADLAPPPAAPAVPEPDMPTPTDRPHRRVVTRTLAELFVAQGQRDRAVEMYEELVSRSPDDETLRDRLAELRSDDWEPESAGDPEGETENPRAESHMRTDAPDDASAETSDTHLAAVEEVDVDGMDLDDDIDPDLHAVDAGTVDVGDPGTGALEVPAEADAAEEEEFDPRLSPAAPEPDVSTPFAWTSAGDGEGDDGAPESEPTEEAEEGRISDYLGGLLGYSPDPAPDDDPSRS